MTKLILSLDDQVLKEIPLTKERTTIGRKATNDIQIDNLALSGEHAVIVMIANDCSLEDLDSTNGTLVNGKPVKKHLLHNNDVIELGKYKLKFVGKGPPAPTANEDYEKTMLWRPATMKPPAEPAAAAGQSATAPAVPAASAPSVAAPGPAAPAPRAAPPAPAAPPPRAAAPAPVSPPVRAAAPAPVAAKSAAPKVAPAPAAPPPAANRVPPGPSVQPIWKVILVALAVFMVAVLVYRIRG